MNKIIRASGLPALLVLSGVAISSSAAALTCRPGERQRCEFDPETRRVICECVPISPPPPTRSLRWGAIAYSDSTGAVGWGWGYESRDSAESAALMQCATRANDCHVAVQVSGGCAALAKGIVDGIHGAGWSRGISAREAERDALTECSKRTKNCTVINSGCEI